MSLLPLGRQSILTLGRLVGRLGERAAQPRRAIGAQHAADGSPGVACRDWFGDSGFMNFQITANLPHQEVLDLAVPRHRAPSVPGWVVPPRVAAAFAEQDAPFGREMPD